MTRHSDSASDLITSVSTPTHQSPQSLDIILSISSARHHDAPHCRPRRRPVLRRSLCVAPADRYIVITVMTRLLFTTAVFTERRPDCLSSSHRSHSTRSVFTASRPDYLSSPHRSHSHSTRGALPRPSALDRLTSHGIRLSTSPHSPPTGTAIHPLSVGSDRPLDRVTSIFVYISYLG